MRPGFRTRLFLILAVFAALPALAVTSVAVVAFDRAATTLGMGGAWDNVAATGREALTAARASNPDSVQRAALDAHEAQLQASITRALQVRHLARRVWLVFTLVALLGLALLAYPTYRVAGHLSRQLSRPLDELVGWTGMIARGERLPERIEGRGAPEFEVLRTGMRAMASELEAGRARAVESERLRAFRESARRFAHELKNPLTPIRFALARLRVSARDAESHEPLAVLATEVDRLDAMARSFSQFGRLPEGPMAEIDVAEMVQYAARSVVHDGIALSIEGPTSGLSIRGQHDGLTRAIANILLNAVEACGTHGEITVRYGPSQIRGAPGARFAVTDSGPGIAAEKLPGIWEPYVTDKPAGTGLGLAIVRQTVEAHGGIVFAERSAGRTKIGFVVPADGGTGGVSAAHSS